MKQTGARRIKWSRAERAMVLDRAIELVSRKEYPTLTALLREAQQVLPPDRQRPDDTVSPGAAYNRFEWFTTGLRERLEAIRSAEMPPEAPAADGPPAPMPAPPSGPPRGGTRPEAAQPEPTPAESGPTAPQHMGSQPAYGGIEPTPAEISHAASRPAPTPDMPMSGPDIATTVATIITAFVDERQRLFATLQAIQHELVAIKLAIKSLHGELVTRGTDGPVLRPSPPAVPPPPSARTDQDSDRTNGRINRHDIGKSSPAMRRPRIVIIGPLRDQFDEIERRVGPTIELIYVDKDRGIGRGDLPDADGYVLTRHLSHAWWHRILSQAGKSRVVRHPTGGIGQIVETIRDLARRARGPVPVGERVPC